VKPRVAAIVLAGGRGVRLGRTNKVYLPLGGRPLLEYSLGTFGSSGSVLQLVVVARMEDRSTLQEIVDRMKLAIPVTVVKGGPTRHRSEAAGLESLAVQIEAGAFDLIAIHDGARPFMTLELLEACIGLAARVGGAFPALPPASPDDRVDRHRISPGDQTTLIRVQTPQIFEAVRLLRAYREAAAAGFEGVDTAETVERFSNLTPGVVAGDEANLKITLPDDLVRAAEYVSRWEAGRWRINPET
jgi:2-C-methyl-D-erythritol 4-phosphate cytidylyltransferase